MNRPESHILDDLKTMLEFYQTLGIEGIPLRMTSLCGIAEDSADKKTSLLALRNEIGDCVRCKLSKNRNTIVFGEGNPGDRKSVV